MNTLKLTRGLSIKNLPKVSPTILSIIMAVNIVAIPSTLQAQGAIIPGVPPFPIPHLPGKAERDERISKWIQGKIENIFNPNPAYNFSPPEGNEDDFEKFHAMIISKLTLVDNMCLVLNQPQNKSDFIQNCNSCMMHINRVLQELRKLLKDETDQQKRVLLEKSISNLEIVFSGVEKSCNDPKNL